MARDVVLVGGLDVGIDEGDRDRLDSLAAQDCDDLVELLEGGAASDGAVGVHALVDFDPHRPPREDRIALVEEVEGLGPRAAADVEDVGESLRRNESDARAAAFYE